MPLLEREIFMVTLSQRLRNVLSAILAFFAFDCDRSKINNLTVLIGKTRGVQITLSMLQYNRRRSVSKLHKYTLPQYNRGRLAMK